MTALLGFQRPSVPFAAIREEFASRITIVE